jgi:GntR family transcriptional regulator
VSRPTIRRALATLEREGLVARHGRGWHAADQPLSEPPNALVGFTAMARARGLTATSRVLERAVVAAGVADADALHVAAGSRLIMIERLRLLDGIPTAVDRAVVPFDRAPWLETADLESESLHELLEAHGFVPTKGEYAFYVSDADSRHASLLDVKIGRGLLTARGRTFDQHSNPIELVSIAYHPERYRFQTVLRR